MHPTHGRKKQNNKQQMNWIGWIGLPRFYFGFVEFHESSPIQKHVRKRWWRLNRPSAAAFDMNSF